MKNNALLQQLGLAKQAGTKQMAKDFFAKTPNAAAEPGAEGEMPAEGVQTSAPAGEPGAAPVGDAQAMSPEEMTPEQLEELLRMLEGQGGAEG